MAIFVLFGAVMVLVLLNVPIAIALGVVALVAILHAGGIAALANVPLVMYTGSTSFPLIAIPLFILAGAIMNASGISRRLIALSSAAFGCGRAALAQVTIVTSLFFAEISGSAVADAAALGTILIPAMKSKGYSKEFSAAVLSSASTLAVIIPPSIPMILYAAMADTSVVKLFVAGVVPGVLGGLLMLLNLLFLLLGLFLHSAAAIILVIPVVMPLVQAVGIDPVHFGIIVTINLGIGQQTPPVASVLTVACSIARADIWEVTKVNLWFIGVLLLVLLLSTYLPVVPLALVRLFYGG